MTENPFGSIISYSGKGVSVLDANTDIRYLKGVGEARAKAYGKLGIETLGDLVGFFPRTYEDRTQFRTISQLQLGEAACVRAMVATEPTLSFVRKGLTYVKCRVSDGHGTMQLTFFNAPYVRDKLRVGENYVFYGKNTGNLIGPAMTNPLFEEDGAGYLMGKLVPVYPMTSGLTQKQLHTAVRTALDTCLDGMEDILPEDVRERHRLCRSRYAYETIHFPKDAGELEIARRRLIFEELFLFSCGLALLRGSKETKYAKPLPKAELEAFFESLPFTLTGAQMRACREMAADLSKPTPMARLVQGDVGSGKTVVAAAGCWYAWKAGRQAAFMAPTEILAGQHLKTLTKFLAPFGIRVGLLTGSMTAKQKREVNTALQSGEIDVIVGTHALITENVAFRDLALVITDEQHRFGVHQRAALSEKGDSPHVLVMSATPIPRTLALILYGDLDVSVIDELPPGRKKVDTFAVGEDMRQRIYRFMDRLVGEGRQVFVICPKVENEDGSEDLKAVEEYAGKLQKEIFPHLRVAYLHGKMKPKDKDAIMAAFAAGETDILVSTTVVEVGVDVPNAALIVVENADRFGLSQLHQLRGRVGRGQHESYCVLFKGAGGGASQERLSALCATNDGFKLAEEDLHLRGPGDFFGARQSGLPEMRVAEFAADVDVLQAARDEALALLRDDPKLAKPEHEALAKRVSAMMEKSRSTMN